MELCAKVQATVTVFVSVGGFCKADLVEDSLEVANVRRQQSYVLTS
jgi:hypothetical protein